MKLIYHKGKNFGDAINPLIFNRLLPDFFDENENEIFLGIGSIIGLKQNYKQKKIVFSSGFAAGNDNTYGSKPVLDLSWDFKCVRGPLTAEILKLDKNLAVADGAILLNIYYDKKEEKKFKYSYMPHHKSFDMYDGWKELLALTGVNLIDPRDDVDDILSDIDSSEFLITEAMHGAIVADALRVPWIGTFAYPYINKFKWNDWAGSLEMKIKLESLATVHDFDFFKNIIKSKTRNILPDFVLNKTTKLVVNKRESEFLKRIELLKGMDFKLSNETILKSKCDQLQSIANDLMKLHQ
jgi:succinoglycan biosynthesis protein ExoV